MPVFYLYLYEDGKLEQFVNPGGNSWLDDNHYVVYRCDHSDLEDDWYDEDGELMVEPWDVRDAACGHIDTIIGNLEREDNYLGFTKADPDSTIPEIFNRTIENCLFYERENQVTKLKNEVQCLRGIAYCMETLGKNPWTGEALRLFTGWG